MHQKQVYQSLVGYNNWIVACIFPEIVPVLIFIASYRNAPHTQHYKVIVYYIKYLTTTNEYEISFHSKSSSTIQAFKYFPHHQDKEAYTEMTAPSHSEYHQLTAFCNTCWSGQFGSAAKQGNPIEMFKFRSLSVY